MRQAAIFLTAVALAAAITCTPSTEGKGMVASATKDWKTRAPRSRFLASVDSKANKCDMDPRVCLSAGSPGPDCCRQVCVDLNTDRRNCGKCGQICKFTETCCGGECVNLAYDKRHCGSCVNKCSNGELCIYGLCDYA